MKQNVLHLPKKETEKDGRIYLVRGDNLLAAQVVEKVKAAKTGEAVYLTDKEFNAWCNSVRTL